MADLPSFRAAEIAIGDVPTAPAGTVFIFIDSADKRIKTKDDTGAVIDLTAGGAPLITSVFGRTGNVIAVSGDYDGSEITYTPVDLSDWAGGVDPGQVDDALDQLVDRLAAEEASARVTGLTGDVGGTTTGSPVTISGGVHFGTIRAADVISLPVSGTFHGSVQGVGVGATKVHAWGAELADVIPIFMHRTGRVRVASVSLSTAITAGTLDLQVTVNAIAQTAETLTLAASAKNGSLIFATPIELAIGDELNLQTVTSGAFSPSQIDTLSFLIVELDP